MRKNYRPVLIIQGFEPGGISTNLNRQFQYTTPVDRGNLKYLDVVFFDDNVSSILNEPGFFTVAVGGQNVIETESFPNWDIEAQLGKDETWDVRTYAAENQTISMTVNTTNSITPKFWQLIAKYTTAAHEEFLKNWKLKFTPGMKRKGYQVTRPIGTITPVTFSVQLPRQKGDIIGLAISNGGRVDLVDQLNTLIDVYIDGVKIVDKVQAGYFNKQSGRDSYLNKILILPGATMKIDLTVANLPIIGTVAALETVVHDFCIYFDN